MLTKIEMKIKSRTLIKIKNIFDKLNIDYFIGGSTLLGIMRNGDLKNWPYGISIALKYEDYADNLEKFKILLVKQGFEIKLNRNSSSLKEKIKVYYKNHFFEITPWYPNGQMRIRSKFQLPDKFFISGHFEFMRGLWWQTFNTPDEYLTFRFGKNWIVPIDSRQRKKYETSHYRRKR